MNNPELPKVEVTNRAYGDIASLQQLDESTLDPNKHYRWVRADPLRIGRARMKGYTIVEKDTGVMTMAQYIDPTTDGSIRIMDTILMACDQQEWLRRKDGRTGTEHRFSEKRLTAPKKQFKRRARERKFRVLRDDEE